MSIKARILSLVIILIFLVVVWLIGIALDTHFNSKIMRGAVYGAVRSIILPKASNESTAPTGLCGNSTLDVVDEYFDPYTADVRGAVLTADKNYIIWGATNGTIRRIRTSDFVDDLTAYSNHKLAAALTNENTSYVWFGSLRMGTGVPVTIDKFDTGQFLVVEQTSIAGTEGGSAWSATISEDYQTGLWFSSYPWIIKVDLQSMTGSSYQNPQDPYKEYNSNRLAYNSYAYVGEYNQQYGGKFLTGIRISDLSERISSIVLGDDPIAINRSNGLAYVIDVNNTGKLLEIRLQDFAVLRVGPDVLGIGSGQCYFECDSVVDEVNNLLYIFGGVDQYYLYVVNLDNLSVVESMWLGPYWAYGTNMLLDTQNGYLYISLHAEPATFYKIDVCLDF